MNKLLVSALMLVATSQAIGCILVSDDDDTGSASVTWATLTAGEDSVARPAACPAGATSAVIFALPSGETEPFEDRYLCADGAGTVSDLPAGTYTVWVRLTDNSLVTRYAESSSQIVNVVAGSTATVPEYDIFVDHAFYTVDWDLSVNGSSATCSQISNAGDVAIDATDGGGSLYDNEVPCTAGQGGTLATTAPLPIGSAYTISVSLLHVETGAAIGTAPAIPSAEAGILEYGNEYSDLGTVSIDL